MVLSLFQGIKFKQSLLSLLAQKMFVFFSESMKYSSIVDVLSSNGISVSTTSTKNSGEAAYNFNKNYSLTFKFFTHF